MLFNSLEFLCFFPIVTLVYFFVPRKFKMYWLLVASYFFYMSWNAKYGLLILSCTLVTYLTGLAIEKSREAGGKAKLLVAASSVFLLGALVYYKYAEYGAYILSRLFNRDEWAEISIVLPVGISFFTFQSLGYVIDVYRKNVRAEKNFFKYALFISFFPQLVAGPIERSGNLLHQLAEEHRFDFDRFRKGMLYMVWGYFLKLVVADRAGLYVDYVYENCQEATGLMVVLATVLFAFQIYGDFGGYSAIAIGAAKIFGIDLMENFNAPYYACSVADFWRRWHISLNTWFRDYLYIPLGGNRRGKVRKIINQLIVFGLSGLWHGASVTFFLWGLISGVMVILSGFTAKIKLKIAKPIEIFVTFVFVDFAWLFFRAQNLTTLRTLFEKILGGMKFSSFAELIPTEVLNTGNVILLIIAIIFVMFIDGLKYRKISVIDVLTDYQNLAWAVSCGLVISFILVFGIWGNAYDAADFIYFQF